MHDTLYLGEMAQHQVDLAGAVWKVFELHPKIVARDGEQSAVALWCRPENVVVLTR